MNPSIIRRLEALEAQKNVKSQRHLIHDGDGFIVLPDSKERKIYQPSKTGKMFHVDRSLVRLIKGPYGSGKSTMCCAEVVKQACQMPKWYKGIRRSRWAFVRNTAGELYTTTLQTWLSWFDGLGDIYKRQKPVLTYEHAFNDDEGIVELEILFLALDRENDLRKIRSLELTGAYINEFSEAPPGILSHFKGRIDRYPAHDDAPEGYFSGIIGDTNPPDTDHEIYKTFENNPDPSYKIFHQPPGLLEDKDGNYYPNTEADNYEHLGKNYYLNMAKGETKEFIKVFCKGEYGTVISGKRVYPEYNDDLHSVDDIAPIIGLPIDLSWDFGLTPACIVSQFTAQGQLLILREFCADYMSLDDFVKNIVVPVLQTDFAMFPISSSVGDPAGNKGMDTNNQSCFELLAESGIPTDPAMTNAVLPRIDAVKFFLSRLTMGKPSFLISRKGCPVTVKGFRGNYHFKRVRVLGEERYKDEPNKNEASHPHDCVQYRALQYSYEYIKSKNQKSYDDFINLPASL